MLTQTAQPTGLSQRRPTRTPRRLGWLCALLIGLLPLAAQAQPFSVLDTRTTLEGGVYRLDADLSFKLPDKAIAALENGIPLTFALDIEVTRSRRYVWDDHVASLEQRATIQYFALADHYLLHNLNSGHKTSYSTLARALHALGQIRGLPLIDAKLLDAGERYSVSIRSYLDFSGLPAPLRMRAYISSDWWLTSGWHTRDLVMPE